MRDRQAMQPAAGGAAGSAVRGQCAGVHAGVAHALQLRGRRARIRPAGQARAVRVAGGAGGAAGARAARLGALCRCVLLLLFLLSLCSLDCAFGGCPLHIPFWFYEKLSFGYNRKGRKMGWGGFWLRRAKQFFRWALVRGRRIVLRHYCNRISKGAGNHLRDGAVVRIRVRMESLVLQSIALSGFAPVMY